MTPALCVEAFFDAFSLAKVGEVTRLTCLGVVCLGQGVTAVRHPSETAPVDDNSTRPAEQLAAPEPAGQDDPEIAEDGEEPEVRRCQRCTRDLPEQWFAPSHWAAANRSGANKRACMRCAPHTTPAGQRFCNTCERAKDQRAFGPAKGGKVERVCKSCYATQGRLNFFLQGSQGKSRTQ